MFVKITRGSVFDIKNPERKFKENEVLKINDPKRAKSMLSKGLGIEVKDVKDYVELDKEEIKEVKETQKKATKKPSTK